MTRRAAPQPAPGQDATPDRSLGAPLEHPPAPARLGLSAPRQRCPQFQGGGADAGLRGTQRDLLQPADLRRRLAEEGRQQERLSLRPGQPRTAVPTRSMSSRPRKAGRNPHRAGPGARVRWRLTGCVSRRMTSPPVRRCGGLGGAGASGRRGGRPGSGAPRCARGSR